VVNKKDRATRARGVAAIFRTRGNEIETAAAESERRYLSKTNNYCYNREDIAIADHEEERRGEEKNERRKFFSMVERSKRRW